MLGCFGRPAPRSASVAPDVVEPVVLNPPKKQPSPANIDDVQESFQRRREIDKSRRTSKEDLEDLSDSFQRRCDSEKRRSSRDDPQQQMTVEKRRASDSEIDEALRSVGVIAGGNAAGANLSGGNARGRQLLRV